jgi:hypothetical protein
MLESWRCVVPGRVVAALSVGVLLGSGALALGNTVTGPGGAIHACSERQGGWLRMVRSGKRCPRGQRAITWNQRGPQGAAGANGSAVAFAHVMFNGTLDPAHSKNVLAASRITSGIFCLKVAVPVSNATGMVDAGNTPAGGFGYVSAVLRGEDPSDFTGRVCPSGDNVLVGTADHTGTNADMAFWINFN